MSERVVVGIVRRTRGVRGELVVESQTDVPDRFHQLKEVFLVTPSGARRVTIDHARYVRNEIWVTLAEVTQREEAQELRGATIEVEIEQRPKLPAGEFYYDELIGIEVFDTHAVRIGTLTQVYPRGGQDVYGVETDFGEALVPASEEIIRSVDIEHRRMVIDPPEGLLPQADAN